MNEKYVGDRDTNMQSHIKISQDNSYIATHDADTKFISACVCAATKDREREREREYLILIS